MSLKRSQTVNFQLENHQFYESAPVEKTQRMLKCVENSPKFELIHFCSYLGFVFTPFPALCAFILFKPGYFMTLSVVLQEQDCGC